ncbi:Ig-like domain-containing protein [Moraxella bovoculi]|uniref:Ig-like domain-containing protein n=1 Tax=Moraxella bovoculi TaxID=386891 RepID=UPI003F50A051
MQAGTPAKVTFKVADDEGLNTAKPLTDDKVNVTGGTLSEFKKIDDNTYEAIITPTAPAEEVVVTVEEGAVSDNAQNQNQPKTVTTAVTDSTAPVFLDENIEVSYKENQAKDGGKAPVIGEVTATDADSAVTGYTITSGNEAGYFAIDKDGNITLTDAGIAASAPSNDFETMPNEFTIEVSATNAYGTVSEPKSVKVAITNDPDDDEPTTSEVAPDGVVNNPTDSVDEGSSLVTTVTLDGNKGNPSLPFTLGGTNTPDEDLGEPEFSHDVTKNLDGTLKVPAGVTSFTITTPVVADDKTETAPETVEVSVGGVKGKPVTINDTSKTPDANAPTVEITVETPAGGKLQAGTPAKVTFKVADDEGLNTAKPLTDDKVNVTGGTLSEFKKIDDNTYEAIITPTAPAEEVVVTVEEGAVSDNAQNQNQPKTVTTAVTDSTAPVFLDENIEVSYKENQAKDGGKAPVIGEVTATDADSAVTGYTITSGNEAGYFAIDKDGNITLTDAGIAASAPSNDFETMPNEFTIEVSATNAYGTVSEPKSVKVAITNDPDDDEPTTSEVAPDGVVNNPTDSVDEGSSLVTTVTLDGNKGNPSLPFTLGGTNTPDEDLGEPEFSHDVTKNLDGTLKVPAGVTSFTITTPVVADDKTETAPETVEVSVGGVKGKPVTINDTSKTPDANAPTVEITVETPAGGKLQAGTPAKVTFKVADDEGLNTAKPLTDDKVNVTGGTLSEFKKIDDNTYEAIITPTAPAEEVVVTVEEGAVSDNAQNQNQPKTVTTAVTDSTAPVFLDENIEVSYKENQAKDGGKAPVIGEVTATDADSAVTGYTITSGNEAGYFAIDKDGNITLTDAGIAASAPSNDFETMPNEFTIEVSATNAYGTVSEPKSVKVAITNDPDDDEPTTSEVAPDGVVNNPTDSVDEGSSLVTTVTLDGNKGNPSLPFTLGGTNTPDEDLGEPEFSHDVTKNLDGTLKVPAGVTSFTITTPVVADDKTETAPETVEVSVGGVKGKPVTINDTSKTPDANAPTVEITVETPAGGKLQAGTPAKVTFKVADDEGLNTAKPLTDDKVNVTGGTLSEFKKIDDNTYEAIITPTAPAEEVVVTVEEGAVSDNAQNQNQPKTVTTAVTDSTAPVFLDENIEVSYKENQAKDGGKAPVIGEVTATDADSAVTGYTITSGNEAGYFAIDKDGNITLTDAGIAASAPSNDFETMPNEFTIEVSATNAYGTVSEPKSVKVAITNDPDDDEPTTSEVAPDGVVNNPTDSVDEGSSLVTTVTLDGNKGNPSLPFTLGGTNTPDEDLGEPEFSHDVTKNLDGTLKVPAGVTSFTITTPVVADDKTETAPETVEVSVGGVKGKPVTINDTSKTPDANAPTVEITVETPAGGKLQAGTPAKVTFKVADDEGLNTAKPLTDDKVNVTGGTLSEFKKIDDNTYEAIITPTAPAEEVVVTVEEGAVSDNAQNQNQPKTVTTAVTDSTAPVFLDENIEVSYKENQAKDGGKAPVIGEVTATDADSAVTGYTITSGNEAGYFAIDKDGNITLTDAGIAASAPSNDFETMPNEFTIEVSATNAYGTVSEPKSVKVAITNDPDDDEPTTSEVAPDGVVNNPTDSVDEGSSLVTTVTLDGNKGNPSLPFTLGGTNTPDEDLGEPEFSHDVTKNLDGTLKVPAGVTSFTITTPVVADDKTETAPETVEVSVGGVKGKPVTINDTSKTPDANAPTVEITVETPAGGKLQAGTPAKVTFKVADDEGLNTAKPLTDDKVNVTGGTLSEFKKIDDNTYEAIITPTAPAEEVVVTVEEGAVSDNAQNQNQPKTVTTAVTDSTAPVFLDENIEVSYKENQAKDGGKAPVIGEVTATDADSAVTGYTITSGNEAGYFAIDKDGNITLTDAGIAASAPSNDFETMPNEFTIEVSATNAYGTVSEPKSVKVAITNDPDDDEPTTSEVAPDGVVNNPTDSVDEGSSLVTTVTLDGNKGNPSLPFTLGGTNTPDEDLGEPEFSHDVTKNLDGTLKVPAGVTSFTITTPVVADDKTETAPETVEVSVGGVKGKPVTINDTSKTPDANAPTVEITVETPAGGKLQAGTPAKVTFKVADDEGLNTAKPLTDDKVNVTGGTLSEFKKIDDNTYEAIITPTAPAEEVVVTVEEGAVSDNAQNQNQPKTVTTAVTDSTAPVFLDENIEVSYKENQAKDGGKAPVIGEVTATDADSAVTGYTITSGNEAGYFAIDKDGNITLTDAGIAASAPSNDFETMPNEFTIEVSATNAYGTVSEPKSVKVAITNDPDDDEPTTSEVAPDGVVNNPTDSVDEGSSLVTTVTLDGNKGNPSLPFTLGGTNTPDEDLGEPEFSHDVTKNLDGTLKVPAGVTSFTITTPVVADDKTETAPETVEVSVGGVKGKPVTINDTSKTPDANAPTVEITVETPAGGKLQAGTPAKVTFKVADDEGLNTAKPLTDDKVNVTGGTLSEFKKIDDNTYEAIITPTAPAEEVVVTVEEGAVSDNAQNQNQPKTVTTAVTDSTAPVFLDENIEVSYKENQAKDGGKAPVIGEVTATDADSAVTGYTITSGNEAGYFAIDKDGNITLTDAGIAASAPSNDFETMPNEFTIEVSATNAYGTVSEPKSVKVAITNDPSDDPVTPLILSLNSDTESEDTEGADSEKVTNDPVINVANADGKAWEYSLDGGKTYQDGEGTSFTLPENGLLSGKKHNLVARLKDNDDSKGTLDVTYDHVAGFAEPSEINNSTPLSFGVEGGRPVLKGTTEPGAVVELNSKSGRQSATKVANGEGEFTFEHYDISKVLGTELSVGDSVVPAGHYELPKMSIKVTDKAGNVFGEPPYVQEYRMIQVNDLRKFHVGVAGKFKAGKQEYQKVEEFLQQNDTNDIILVGLGSSARGNIGYGVAGRGNTVDIDTGDGDDTILAGGSFDYEWTRKNATIKMGDGNDTFMIEAYMRGMAKKEIDMGAGNDFVKLGAAYLGNGKGLTYLKHSIDNNATVKLGDGNDVMEVHQKIGSSTNILVDGGTGYDTLRFADIVEGPTNFGQDFSNLINFELIDLGGYQITLNNAEGSDKNRNGIDVAMVSRNEAIKSKWFEVDGVKYKGLVIKGTSGKVDLDMPNFVNVSDPELAPRGYQAYSSHDGETVVLVQNGIEVI